jgi:hypothetical protein
MDPIVEAALRKWPNVPHCHGWLALDARGDWYMRDDRAQAAGPFPQVKGSVIRHDKLRDFIHRNYLRDERGSAYFQNGPQRVYVDLEAAPYVWRLQTGPGGTIVAHAHTGEVVQAVDEVCLDDRGRVFLATQLATVGRAFGIVHTQDMEVVADAVESGRWQPQDMPFEEMPSRFGYRLMPR